MAVRMHFASSPSCSTRARRSMWRFFTEDFQLEDPGAGVIRTGLDAAQRMMEAVRALAHDGQLEILDMFDSGLAVR
jgi:hypothetical protein